MLSTTPKNASMDQVAADNPQDGAVGSAASMPHTERQLDQALVRSFSDDGMQGSPRAAAAWLHEIYADNETAIRLEMPKTADTSVIASGQHMHPAANKAANARSHPDASQHVDSALLESSRSHGLQSHHRWIRWQMLQV